MTDSDFDFTYDEAQAKEAGQLSSGPIPNGVYRIACVKCEAYTTRGSDKNPPHKALKAEFVIVDGEYSKRHLFVNYIRCDGSKSMPDLNAWYKMSGLEVKKVKISKASDLIGTEFLAPVVQYKTKPYTDPSTGKTYPAKIDNKIVFTIDDPEKIVKIATVPVISPSESAGASPADKSEDWA